MALNKYKESENKSPAACLLITNQQSHSSNQFPRKLSTEMSEPDELFKNSTVFVECEPRMLDVNSPDVVQNDSGIELESQIVQCDGTINNGDISKSDITHEDIENESTGNIHGDEKFILQNSKNERVPNRERVTDEIGGERKDERFPQRRKSCPEPAGLSKLSLTLPPSSADDNTSVELRSTTGLSLEEVTNLARKMSRPLLHKDGSLKEEDHHYDEHSVPHFEKQTRREFQKRYRPISESPRYYSEDKVVSPRSPRNRGMAYAFSMDESRFSNNKTSSSYRVPHSNTQNVSNITAIESQVITNNEITDEQRALNDITAMTRKATRPTIKDLDLKSPTKVRSKSFSQIKSPLAPALSPVRSSFNDRSPDQAFRYPENQHEKVRSKSVAHMALSTNPALSPLRSPVSDRFPLSRSSSTSSSSDYSPRNNVVDPCFKCWKTVYPLDKVGPIRKVLFHKMCFKCFECGTSLTLNNYYQNSDDKMDKALYCKTHQPVLEKCHVTLQDRNLNITMNYPKLDNYNSNIRVPHEDRSNTSNIRPLSFRGAASVPKLDIVCGDSLNDSFSSRTHHGTPRGTPRKIDTNGNEFEDQILETRSRQTAMIQSPRHLSLADDIKLTPVWSRSALNAAHLDIGPMNRNTHHFYSYSSDAWSNL